jgi:hypothetical protein
MLRRIVAAEYWRRRSSNAPSKTATEGATRQARWNVSATTPQTLDRRPGSTLPIGTIAIDPRGGVAEFPSVIALPLKTQHRILANEIRPNIDLMTPRGNGRGKRR